jgi:hypothetical protein
MNQMTPAQCRSQGNYRHAPFGVRGFLQPVLFDVLRSISRNYQSF